MVARFEYGKIMKNRSDGEFYVKILMQTKRRMVRHKHEHVGKPDGKI